MSNKRATKVAGRKDRQDRDKRTAQSRVITRSRSLHEVVGPDRLRGYYWAANRRPSTWHDLYARHFDQRSAYATRVGSLMPGRADNHADDIINIATVETAYATFYRVHARSHFRSGASFPENWQPWPEKVTRAERFSPPESVGWYLGLTVAAAFDEAAYYQAQATTTPAPTVLLVIECCLSNILYLAWPPVLMALWEKLALPPTDVFGMQLAIMDRKTDNAITDRIGLWARERGFGGIIFPTARYDARVSLEEEIAKRVRPPLLVPVINYVPVWSRLEVQGGLHMTAGIGDQLRFACLSQRGLKDDETLDVPAELNVVLFSGEQLQGTRHPVFYQTFPMEAWREASAQETRRDTWRNTFHVDLGAKP